MTITSDLIISLQHIKMLVHYFKALQKDDTMSAKKQLCLVFLLYKFQNGKLHSQSTQLIQANSCFWNHPPIKCLFTQLSLPTFLKCYSGFVLQKVFPGFHHELPIISLDRIYHRNISHWVPDMGPSWLCLFLFFLKKKFLLATCVKRCRIITKHPADWV